VVARYVTPVIALALLGLRLRRGAWRREDWLVFVMLLTAFLVSAWQVRGTTFSIAFAAIPLAAWVGGWRERALAAGTTGAQLQMALVWIVSLNVSWMGIATAASVAADSITNTVDHRASGDGKDDDCDMAADFVQLAGLPETTVLAVSNLGSPILVYTGHRALAGPYHRNIAGNLAVLDAFTGPIAAAEAVVRDQHVGIVAICHDDPEQKMLSAAAPDGLLAALLHGKAPVWLEAVDAGTGALRLYRVR
jgi:hypothetical protein